jgi:hypothetical protein
MAVTELVLGGPGVGVGEPSVQAIGCWLGDVFCRGRTRKDAEKCSGWLGGLLTTKGSKGCGVGVSWGEQWSVISGQWGLRLGGRGCCRAESRRVCVTELVLGGPGVGVG